MESDYGSTRKLFRSRSYMRALTLSFIVTKRYITGYKKEITTKQPLSAAVNASVNSYAVANDGQRVPYFCLIFCFTFTFCEKFFKLANSFLTDKLGPLSEADFVCQCELFRLSLLRTRRRICSVFCSQSKMGARVLSHKFSFARK